MSSSIYDHIDNVKTRNQFPENQPDDKQRPSNPEGDVAPETVDFFQEHPFKDEFNRPTGLLSVYDPNNPDRQLMDCIEEEIIMLSSPPMKYYKLRHTENNIDPLYGESTCRDAYDFPIIIYGNYEAPEMEQELVQWGLQEIEEITIHFNYNMLLNSIGDKLQIGDIVQTYDAKLWEVMTSLVIDEELWRAQHNQIRAKRLMTEGKFLPDQGEITRSPNIPFIDNGLIP